jgi:hypothetical protein
MFSRVERKELNCWNSELNRPDQPRYPLPDIVSRGYLSGFLNRDDWLAISHKDDVGPVIDNQIVNYGGI